MSTTIGRKPEVVQVVPFFPPRLGGMEIVAREIATGLASRRDVQVITTTCGAGGAPRAERLSGVRVRRFRGLNVAHTPISPGFALALLRLPRGNVLHAHLAQAFAPEVVWLTSWLRRRPYLVHFHLDVDPSGRLGFLLGAYKRWVLGPVLRGAARVIALSAEQAAFIARAHQVPADRIRIVPNGVSANFTPSLGINLGPVTAEAPLRLLFVGRLDAQKNVGRLLAAMSRVTAPVELVVVGDGEERDLLRAEAEQLGRNNVRFAGAQRDAALRQAYHEADAFVLPSDREGMPLVLLEAMASGLPIIATDVPGNRELLHDVGLLAAPEPAALAAAIDRIAGDSVLRADLSRRSRERSVEHTWERRIAELEEIYAEAVPVP